MLLKLDIPEVSVPRARTDASSALTPVTINDWLMYCIVRDDELDTEIFGHKDQFADRKRRAVFELNYGVYDSELANLQANYRGVELRLEDLERTAAAVTDFLNATPFQSLDRIDSELQQAQDSLLQLEQQSADLATQAHSESTSLDIRRQIAKIEASLGEQENELQAALKSFADLTDLRSTLSAQSQRLIRAIVADEWLVDFDFIVCPRCGTEIDDSRTSPEQCYLCLQAPQTGDFHSELIKEQERIASQVIETNGLLVQRESEISGQQRAIVQSQAELEALHRDLNLRTAHFVSAHSDAMTSLASGQARLREEIQRLLEYRDLVVRFNDLSSLRSRLEEERSDLSEALKLRVRHSEEAERLIGQLESRFQEYLERLHISLSDLPLIASINRTTYLPEIGGRAFDTLSSQGLSVLVNVAHALAHHTVSIDEGLPLPSLLILDGLSSNVGHEGFDLERRDDTYRLLIEETERYGGRLQVIALDNDVPSFGRDSVVLTLTTEDRLVRSRVKTNV
ncbi:MAG: hypothetical protein OXH86_13640 [Acidimicrobiaceae bacterium]|nr:hypothetical protein [Acidimicrobiaceae bacterium]